jgi:phosphoglucosamine mutase
MRLFPQTLVNVKVAKDYDWQANASLMKEKAAAESELGDGGRVLIRASGTEPLIRVMVEAENAELADKMAHRIADTLRA